MEPSAPGTVPGSLAKIGADLLAWFDEGHPSISADAVQRWSGVAARFLVSVGYLERIPAEELPGVAGDFYRLDPGFRARWERNKGNPATE